MFLGRQNRLDRTERWRWGLFLYVGWKNGVGWTQTQFVPIWAQSFRDLLRLLSLTSTYATVSGSTYNYFLDYVLQSRRLPLGRAHACRILFEAVMVESVIIEVPRYACGLMREDVTAAKALWMLSSRLNKNAE